MLALLASCRLFEPATAPEVTYRWEPPPSPGDVDWRAVHMDHWRAWTIAREEHRPATRDTLLAALAADPGARGVASAALDAATAHDREGFEAQVGLWNAAMDGRGAPWAIRAGHAGDGWYVKSYHVLARPPVALGGRQTPIAWGVRVDDTNVVEGWLGSADDVGDALVVTDRVLDWVLDAVWPRLDPANTDGHAILVRDWARRRLPEDAFAVLTATAPSRAAMVRARDALRERNASCGGTFRIRFDWSGLDDLARLRAFVGRDEDPRCPGILAGEADAIVDGTLAIRAAEGLPAALEALLAKVTAHVAVHETRHVLDHEDWGFGTPPPCRAPGCDEIDGNARIELSAYLSAFASSEWPVAFVQACEVAAAAPGTRAGRAILGLVRALDVACDGQPAPDVPQRAEALAKLWFDRTEAAGFPEPLPERLPLGLARGR